MEEYHWFGEFFTVPESAIIDGDISISVKNGEFEIECATESDTKRLKISVDDLERFLLKYRREVERRKAISGT
jgi:hypothetical protein